LVGCGTCTPGVDLGKLVDSGARKGVPRFLCVCVCVCCKEGGERQAASPLSAVSFLVCANPGVQVVAEHFAKFAKAGRQHRLTGD
jgi:hypothetical protein